MKKSALLIFALLCYTASSFAQSKPSRDLLMLQFTYNNMANTPDSIRMNGFNRGFSAHILYDFPIQKSHFSFAVGIGLGTYNYYLDSQRVVLNEPSNGIQFRKYNPAEVATYKRSKLTTAYGEAPFELRYFGNKENRNRGFKVAIGVKAGLLLSAHSKDRVSIDASYLNQKTSSNRFFQKYSFAPTLRIGYGNFSITGQYNLTQQFKSGSGPEVYPYSIGICLSGL